MAFVVFDFWKGATEMEGTQVFMTTLTLFLWKQAKTHFLANCAAAHAHRSRRNL